MGDGFLHVTTSPARWKGKDFLKLAGFATGAVLISFIDEPFNDWALRTNNPKRRENLENFADIIGKPGPAIIMFSALYGTGLIIDNQDLRDTGVLIFGSLASTIMFQTISKTATGRARPASGYGYHIFKPFNKEPDFHSFPSGHGVSAMTITSVIAQKINVKAIRFAMYGLGIGVGFARAYNQAHWMSDVLVSAGVTYLAVRTVERRYQFKKMARENSFSKSRGARIQFIPYVTGFSLSVKFN